MRGSDKDKQNEVEKQTLNDATKPLGGEAVIGVVVRGEEKESKPTE